MKTEISNEVTRGLGALQIRHPPGTFPVTPASRIALQAIGDHQQLLSGCGIDWGTGSGVLSIAAARIPAVSRLYGIDIETDNVRLARENALANGVGPKTEFFLGDSFQPADPADRDRFEALKGTLDFVLANPPSSSGDDGFAFRRRVLRESRLFLRDGGVVFLNISTQYGKRRIEHLSHDAPGFEHTGPLATTDWVPFDLNRPDLRECLLSYVAEERRGGWEYEFLLPDDSTGKRVNARTAWAHFNQTGHSPLSKWQSHRFCWHPGEGNPRVRDRGSF